ncbi:major facilitator transporter [Caballeronia peredens]|nr:major facilitator transporter [Caballeronia peredens]
MEKLALAFAGIAPITTIFFPVKGRRRTLSIVLFSLATLACLSAAPPELSSKWWYEPSQRVALFHPVLLAGAVSSTCSCASPRTSFWKGVFAGRVATFGLLLGLPMATWLSSTGLPRQSAFSVFACITAVVGLSMLTGSKTGRPPRAQYGVLSIRITRELLLAILATVLQYAAMFAVFSNAYSYLVNQSAFDEPSAAFLMVVFGVGGVLGATLGGRLLAGHSASTALAQPLVLALCYVLLFVLDHTPGVAMATAVLLWGATHNAGTVITRSFLVALAPRAQEVANALHVSAGCAGVLLGVSLASVFMDSFGPMGVLLSGFALTIASLAATAGQLTHVDVRTQIVARDSTD